MITQPESFVCPGGGGGGGGCPNLTTFFLVDDGIEDPNTTISGPSLARQRNSM